mmetsp:Transcript_24814/g.65571  ORF Transcript_24814/g.65571 Transcript_24814/m.65571 type:complete len:295 (-) Transcript_24814:204-1088(-)
MSTTTTPDPLFDLMGWKAEPLLLRRLKLHIVESAIECVVLCFAIRLVSTSLPPPGLFVHMLMVPLLVAGIKLLWAASLASAYYGIKNKDIATVIQRMGPVHTRGSWSCAAATFTCFSCILLVWYSIMFLLMTGYDYGAEEASAAWFLLGMSAVFGVVNWALWRDYVRNIKDDSEDTPDNRVLHQIHGMYRSKAIRMAKHAALSVRQGEAAQETCVVCLDDFQAEDVVAELPCGHVFHPTCAHRWLVQDWRCPLRCALDARQAAKATARVQPAEVSPDLEAGLGRPGAIVPHGPW